MELATLTREDGRSVIRVLPAEEVDDVIKRYNEKAEAKRREEKAKEEAAAAKTT